MKNSAILATLVLSLILITSCSNNPVSSDSNINSDFKLMDTNNVQKTTFKSGENIQFYLNMTNPGNDFTLGIATCTMATFYIYQADSLLGTHLDGTICSTVYITKTFKHNQSIVETGFWVVPNPMVQHQYLLPGNYKAVARSHNISNDTKGTPIVFEKSIDFKVVP